MPDTRDCVSCKYCKDMTESGHRDLCTYPIPSMHTLPRCGGITVHGNEAEYCDQFDKDEG